MYNDGRQQNNDDMEDTKYKRLMTVEMVADRLRVPRSTVLRMLRLKVLNGVKMGKLWRVEELQLQAFLDRLTESNLRTHNDKN